MSSKQVMKRTQFGNPILRQVSRELSGDEVRSAEIQQLIKNMRETLQHKAIGVGLAAPQVGRAVSLAVIYIQPTEHRPNVEPFEAVIINPRITLHKGRRKQQWEGCISAGSSGKADLFAKVLRYHEIKVAYYDETFKHHERQFSGLQAQVMQHEIDHLNGILFVDRVKDTTTFMTYSEYKKRVVKLRKKS